MRDALANFATAPTASEPRDVRQGVFAAANQPCRTGDKFQSPFAFRRWGGTRGSC